MSTYKLNEAIRSGDIIAVKKFLKNGYDVHHENEQALRYACCHGHLNIVKLLLAKGATITEHVINWSVDHQEVVNYLNKQMMLDKLKELG
jgi:ankyrin repeat protein